MSAEIGPGTPLICINAGPAVWAYLYFGITLHSHIELTQGAIYTVEEVEGLAEGTPGCGTCGSKEHLFVKLRGKRGFHGVCRFRPLNDGDTSLVENEKETDSPIVQEGMNILDEAFKETEKA